MQGPALRLSTSAASLQQFRSQSRNVIACSALNLTHRSCAFGMGGNFQSISDYESFVNQINFSKNLQDVNSGDLNASKDCEAMSNGVGLDDAQNSLEIQFG
jgi:hypothetical protein